MKEREALDILKEADAILDGHFVLNSGNHSNKYVNKDAVAPDTERTSQLCEAIAQHFNFLSGIETVVAPATGGIAFAQWTAHHLRNICGHPIFAVFAERGEEILESGLDASSGVLEAKLTCLNHEQTILLKKGQQIVFKGTNFVIKRDHERYVKNANVLVVEDILTTGGSARNVVEAVRGCGGNVVAVGVLCNRGGVTTKELGDVPELFALVNLSLQQWTPDECPLCKRNVPVNTNVGKGKEFLERKKKNA